MHSSSGETRDEKKRRNIEVQDNTVSWVRIVNGVDRYVTESMPTAKEENTSSGDTNC